MAVRALDYREGAIEGLRVEEVAGTLTVSFPPRGARRVWRRSVLLWLGTAAALALGLAAVLRRDGSLDRGMAVMLWVAFAATAFWRCAVHVRVWGREAVVELTAGDLWVTWPDREGDMRRLHVPRWAVRGVRYEAGEGALVVAAMRDEGRRMVFGGEDPALLEQLAGLLRQEMGLKDGDGG